MKHKVVGVGLGKTGTTSLGKALEILGYTNHARYNFDALELYYNNHIEELIEIIKVYDCLEDYPWLFLYKEIYESFPETKFILTIRSNEIEWFESLRAHSYRTGPSKAYKMIFGHYMPIVNQNDAMAFYNNHNKEVKTFFKENAPENLLVLDISNSNKWDHICAFLNKEIPNIPFPKLNENPLKKNRINFGTRIYNKLKKEIGGYFSH